MTIRKAKYFVPNEETQEMEQIMFETQSDQILETGNKYFVTKEQQQFLNDNYKDILLQKDIVNNVNSTETNKPVSAAAVKELADAFGGTEIVVSVNKPEPKAGKIIIWINPQE